MPYRITDMLNPFRCRATCFAAVSLAAIAMTRIAIAAPPPKLGNRAAGVEQFRDRGLGLFIHWGVDGSLGGVISHSLVGASADYQQRFFTQLPQFFDPQHFEPDEWARLAKLVGFKYVVFTTKHHTGFCMWDTKTTDFSVMHTPYGRDLFRQLVDAFRKQGIAIGIYYSPDDFWWLHQHRITINRHVKGIYPQDIPEFLAYTESQLRELLTNYGQIDYFFFDGPAEKLTDFAWQLQPNLIITRGVMETPEQYTPGVALPGAWEGNLTMGTEWPWKPTNETYKSGTALIDTLIETRAKGGNLLLNVGPKPDGVLPIEEESRLREIALWNFVNGEAIRETRPWVITNENNVWFTRKKDSDTVYVFLTDPAPWKLGTARDITLRSVKATEQTRIGVLGQSDQLVEYQPNVNPKTTWSEDKGGLRIKVYRAQRLYTNGRWPNPLVLKLTNVKPAMTPPAVQTISAQWDPRREVEILSGRLLNLGDATTVQTGFQYRQKLNGRDVSEKTEPWVDLQLQNQSAPGDYTFALEHLIPGQQYDLRAKVHHPLIEMYGNEMTFRVP